MRKLKTRDEIKRYLRSEFLDNDEVTGNASGTYTFNPYRAENYLAHNWGLLAEALKAFKFDDKGSEVLKKGAEWCDVLIRCYLLDECLDKFLDEREKFQARIAPPCV